MEEGKKQEEEEEEETIFRNHFFLTISESECIIHLDQNEQFKQSIRS